MVIAEKLTGLEKTIKQHDRTLIEISKPALLSTLISPEIYREICNGKGRLGENYHRFTKSELMGRKGYVGEVKMPQDLAQVEPSKYLIKLFAINMGLGHRRPEEHFTHLANLLGFESVDYFIGGSKKTLPRFLENIETAALDAYMEYSIRAAKEAGTYRGESEYVADINKYRKILDILLCFSSGKKLTADDYQMIYAGKPPTSSPDEIEKFYQRPSLILNKIAKKFLKNENPEQKQCFIFFHPLFPAAFQRVFKSDDYTHSASMVTDLFATPEWITSINQDIPTITATRETQSLLAHYWNKKDEGVNTLLPCVDGFHTSMSGFVSEKLNLKRSESLKNGEPVTYVMTASGVAPAQQTSFENTIANLEEEILQGKAQVVVQCGFGKPGRMLKDSLEKYLADKPQIRDKVCLHWAQSATAAVDFFEAISWSDKPIALVVKASEMLPIALNLNIPIVLTGAIGLQEVENVRQAARSDEAPRVNTRGIFSPLLRREQNPSEATLSGAKGDNTMVLSESTGEKIITAYQNYLSAQGRSAEEIGSLVAQYREDISKRFIPDDQIFERVRRLVENPPPNTNNRAAMLDTLAIVLGLRR